MLPDALQLLVIGNLKSKIGGKSWGENGKHFAVFSHYFNNLVEIVKVVTGRVSFSAFQVPGPLWQGEPS